VWKFGLMQLGGVVGMNAAGWWTATLVTRGDASLVQVALYAVATQLRNVSSLIPSLVQQSNFAFFTDEGGRDFGGANRVIEVSSVIASVFSILCAGLAILVLPTILGRMYGKEYMKAEWAAILAIATVLVHFGVAPAASRLLVVSLFWSGVVNAIWAVFVAVAATVFVPSAGAVAATATLFSAHVLSMFLALLCLWRLDSLPSNVTVLALLDTAIALAMCGVAWCRAAYPESSLLWNVLLLAMTGSTAWLMFRWGQRARILSSELGVESLLKLIRTK
jgi:O-antigen/teichoic acid export membrane protein